MYPKNVLLKYGNSLPEAGERKAFLDLVSRMQTDTSNGIEVVMSGHLKRALEEASLEHLFDDLAQRWLEFVDPTTDLPRNSAG